MTQEAKLVQMLTLQQKLNDETNGDGWERGVTKQGKIIDWRRCIYIESAELIDSYPWKHWKNIDANVDYDNIRVELVDIWHFIMSELLRTNKLTADISIDKLGKRVATTIKNIEVEKKDSFYQEIEEIEQFIAKLFQNFNINELIKEFFKISYMVELDFDSLYRLYIGKNILNKFRQDNGYKSGEYIKIWQDGKEDNVIMQEILSQNDSITPQQLYKELQKSYSLIEDV